MLIAEQSDQDQQQHPSINKAVKTLFITLPQRDTPGTYPPYGALTVMSYLKRAGFSNVTLYNIDLMRPTMKEAINYIADFNPEVLCISAPVSTAYGNCKQVTLEIKKWLPQTKIVLGGNLAASAEIILRKTGVDICVLGEGEIACAQLLEKLSQHCPINELKAIKGLGFLDEKGVFINTGYAQQLLMDQVYDIDWDVWDDFSLKKCFRQLKEIDPKSTYYKYYTGIGGQISSDKRETRIAILPCSKGCVARCTFCHRWQKGIRFIPPEIMIQRIKLLMDSYQVGVVNISDECFGADVKWLHEFCALIKPLGLIWVVGGMRVKQITSEIVSMMKDAGCRSIVYGMETGSKRMIEVMEKRASIEDNERAFRLTLEAGLQTIPQLIIGMPGENPETIKESADFISRNMILDKHQNPREVSINYAQALPGTPLYEFARQKGLIGKGLDEEERYLLHISDRNACDDETTLNFTDYPYLTLVSWRNIILATMKYRYAKAFGISHYNKVMFPDGRPGLWCLLKSRNFGLLLDRFPRLTFRLRHWMEFFKFIDIWKKRGLKIAGGFLVEFFVVHLRRCRKKHSDFEYKSLRKIIGQDASYPCEESDPMASLRKGR
ncbi:MAG: cobalamin-dependent protein [Candidatus Omnitrophica bacterium]|nr:cobalamin-dependent protein [Candidatus Omnitrophota bacterium]